MSSQTTDSQDTFFRLLEYLDYVSSTNLITRETSHENIAAERETTWREARDKLGIDAIYFVANAPVIYFKRFEVPDQARIAALHRNVWSQSKIPLLFVILPGDIRIYSGYEPPKLSKGEALAVASFSLCLALSDYLEPKTIWMQVKFPSLIKEGNLIETDFFDKRVNFAGRTFDLVVGNPPWESQLTEHARIYLHERGLDVGDKQIAQAFLWHAPDFCAIQGKVALVCSSKNLLFRGLL